MTEKNRIETLMRTLNISEKEALQVIEDDKAVDRMTMAELNATYTDEEKAVIKKMTSTGTRKGPTVYKFDQRARKEHPEKADIINTIVEALTDSGATDVDITNKEREFTFKLDGVKYKITMAVPRK